MIAENGESAVLKILESHYISPVALAILLRNPFGSSDFEDFIAERQRTIQEAIENLLIKERLDLSPNLRALDERLERVELRLRTVIATALSNDASRIPSHIVQKTDERITTAARKHPGVDPQEFQRLEKRLEYFDLRELQDTIQSKSLWAEFEGRFASKEMLATKFGQMAELRNCIRHSRSVTEIIRMEGEAAIMWFEQVLKG